MINEPFRATLNVSRANVGTAGVNRADRKEHMKLKSTLIIAALMIAASTAIVSAQEGDGPRQRPQGGPDGGPRPIPPLVAALDANHDGVIDAAEIDNAPAALRKLDKNGDGKLSREELRPPGRPDGMGGPGREEGRKGMRRGPGHPPRGNPGEHGTNPPGQE